MARLPDWMPSTKRRCALPNYASSRLSSTKPKRTSSAGSFPHPLPPHSAIRQWEVAAKAAHIDADTLAATKKGMVAEVNAYIQRKRDAEQETSVRQTALRQAAKEEPTQAGGTDYV